MRVLLLGAGGREHALARALAADPDVTGLHAAPGNPGIAALATVHRADLADIGARCLNTAWILWRSNTDKPRLQGICSPVKRVAPDEKRER